MRLLHRAGARRTPRSRRRPQPRDGVTSNAVSASSISTASVTPDRRPRASASRVASTVVLSRVLAHARAIMPQPRHRRCRSLLSRCRPAGPPEREHPLRLPVLRSTSFQLQKKDTWPTRRPPRRSSHELRDLVAHARSMPMSASCVVNRQRRARRHRRRDRQPARRDRRGAGRDRELPRRPGGRRGRGRADHRGGEGTSRRAGNRDRGDQGRRGRRPPRSWPRPRPTPPRCAARPTRSSTRGWPASSRCWPAPPARSDRPRAVGRAQHDSTAHEDDVGGRRGRAVERRCGHHSRSRDLGTVTSSHRRLDRRSGPGPGHPRPGRRAGELRTVQNTVPAPTELGIAVIRVPEGSPLELDLRLEAVVEGVLVTGTALVAAGGGVRPLPDRARPTRSRSTSRSCSPTPRARPPTRRRRTWTAS